MSICTSLGNGAPAKRVWMLEGQVRRGIQRRGFDSQLEQVKCIHGSLSLRIHASGIKRNARLMNL